MSVPPLLFLLARLYAGAAMLYFGARKLIGDPVDFLKEVRAYALLPDQPAVLLNLTAVCVPVFEVIAGVALLAGWLRRGTGLLSAALLSAFSIAIMLRVPAEMSAQGVGFFELAFDCGCGSGEVVIWSKLLFNLSLILACVLVFAQAVKMRRQSSLPR